MPALSSNPDLAGWRRGLVIGVASPYLTVMTGVKLITCCFCGARDVMTMGKGQRRTLSCLSCGAPMRRIEMIHRSEPAPAPAPVPERIHKHKAPKPHEAYKKKRGKRKKGLFAKIWDEVDDVFDIDDWFD